MATADANGPTRRQRDFEPGIARVFPSRTLDEPAYLAHPYGACDEQQQRQPQPQQQRSHDSNKDPGPIAHSLVYDHDRDTLHTTTHKREGIGTRVRRIMAVVAHPSRPQIRRNSPLAIHRHVAFPTTTPAWQSFGVNDSDSEDDAPPAPKFSKVTQDLLAAAREPSSPPKQEQARIAPRFDRSVSAKTAGMDTPSRAPHIKVIRKSSPSVLGHDRGNTPPRTVMISGKGPGSGARSISISGPYPQRPSFAVKQEPIPEPGGKLDLATPAPAPRALRVTRTRAGSNASQDGQDLPPSSHSRPGSRNGCHPTSLSQDQTRYASDLSRSASLHHAPETVARYGSSTLSRSRNASAEVPLPSGSVRVKRAGLGTGMSLGGKARRFKRRDSEDNISPTDEALVGSASQASNTNHTPQERSISTMDGARSRSGSVNTRATSVEPVTVHDFAGRRNAASESRPSNTNLARSQMSDGSRPPSRQTSRDRFHEYSRQSSAERYQQRRRPSTTAADAPVMLSEQPALKPLGQSQSTTSALESNPPQRGPSLSKPQYRIAPPRIHTDASEDQENMPPPTFRRNKDQEFKYLGQRSIAVLSDDGKPEDLKPRMPAEDTPVPVPPQQQDRKALGSISGNTPYRAAPAPPPKMSVLDTATTTAGASVTKSKKKRTHIVVNGKIFTQMGKIGKGGSSDVYCVMAENFKTFALKRVKLDNCDEGTVRGYKGEIDLLKKLTEVERVVRLFDWELNEEKQELCVLMEKGETDLNRILTLRLNGTDAVFDSAFTRYHWKEMLECVQAVHDHDIVHSDLKPANFLLVQGKLKLIDFGIANAIETDHTVNVHRDSHVGTPNYMSPESITDTNASQSGSMTRDAAGRPLKKDMRIGKASDVWSLGCILYQMTYGRPPFAHIQNQISRIMAITNPNHAIEYPEFGVGNAPISPTLRGLLRRCLDRDPEKRPTIPEMLREEAGWLFPEAEGAVMLTKALLSQIIGKVVEHCGKNGVVDGRVAGESDSRSWAGSFLGTVRKMQAGG
ncbi:hypothetical protein LTS09_014836 [Friedmanniomyces endolithicus]|nr:hypothetical protein LTS09_014836 [Friedmanniomyces endolithicus]